MVRQVCPEIRFSVISTPNPEEHSWNILIINRKRRIEGIWQKFQEAMQPIDEIKDLALEPVPNTKLHYSLSSCVTYKTNLKDVPWGRIYQGPIARDLELFTRKNDALLDYVKKYVERRFG